MVHALHEAWRVLVPQGLMIDLRPYSTEAPVEVVYRGNGDLAGMLDTSLSRNLDEAAEEAVKTVVKEGSFREILQEFFYPAYCWTSFKSMLYDFNNKWKDDVILPEGTLRQARQLFRARSSHARLRVRIRSKLVVYQKL